MDDLDLSIGDVGLDLDLDLSGFSVDIDGAGLGFSTRYAKPPIFKGIADRLVMIENAEKLASQIGIERGMRVHCIVSGDFVFGDFIEALMTTQGIKARRLVIYPCLSTMSTAWQRSQKPATSSGWTFSFLCTSTATTEKG